LAIALPQQVEGRPRPAEAVEPVPRFTAIIGLVPIASHHCMNSSVPNWLLSTVRHATSGRRGRPDRGPTPSRQSYAETKLPPG
jgi:hypothetical protein